MTLSWGRHGGLTVFVSVYPHQVSITRRSQVKYQSHTRGESYLSQIEVADPQFPLLATATLRVVGEGIGEHPC